MLAFRSRPMVEADERIMEGGPFIGWYSQIFGAGIT
jgi:hypothetical protein